MDIAKEIINIIKEISAILGPFIGAIIGYIVAAKTLEKQFFHDSIEKDKERKLITKKEIYLQAVDNLSKANSYLGSIININLQNTNLYDGFKDFFMSVSKINLISTEETIKAITELSTKYQTLILRLMPKLFSLNKIKIDIDIQNNFYNESQKEIKRVIMLMRENSESVNISPERFNRLNETYKFERGQSDTFNGNRKDLNKQYLQEQITFIRKLMGEMKEISPLINSTFYNLRKELEIDTDMKYLNPIFEAQEKTINSELEKFIDYLSNLIEELDKIFSSKDEDNKQ